MDDKELAIWAAGYISGRGSLMTYRGRVRFVLKITGNNFQPLLQVKKAMGLDAGVLPAKINGQPGWRLSVTGKPLHRGMTKLWPWLSIDRKYEYKECREEAAAFPQ